jgi:hypothetical protein
MPRSAAIPCSSSNAIESISAEIPFRTWRRAAPPFQEWIDNLGSERLTGPFLDRLDHHVFILEMNGDSYRLKQSRRKRAPSRECERETGIESRRGRSVNPLRAGPTELPAIGCWVCLFLPKYLHGVYGCNPASGVQSR